MTIDVYEGSHQISRPQLGDYNLNRSALRRALSRWLGAITLVQPSPILPPLQHIADKYGEQITVDAETDLQRYITFMQVGGLSTLGGVPTGYSPFGLNPRHVRPSNTAISVLGEGLAGWYLESLQHMSCLGRPIGVSPDLVFEDAGKTSYALVEVKGTQQSHIHDRMGEAVISLFAIGANLILRDPRTSYDLRVIGVIVNPVAGYQLHSLNISVR